MLKNTNNYYKYIFDFLKYFKFIIIQHDTLNKKLNLLMISEYVAHLEKNLKRFNGLTQKLQEIDVSEYIDELESKIIDYSYVEEYTDLMHMNLYRNQHINFINYWHFHRCMENNMLIPI